MKTSTMMTSAMPSAPVGKAWEEVSASFDRFCLAAGIQTLGAMMEADAGVACGPRHSRSEDRRGHRWGRTAGKIGFHAGKVAIERPRVRGLDGKELPLASWEQAVNEDWLGQWAMNLMLINVSTRKFRRAVRLPAGDVPAPAGSGVSKSAASRHFVVLSAARMQEWMASDLSKLDLLVNPRHPHDRRVGAGGCDRHRWERREASAWPDRGRDGKLSRGPGPDRQSRRARARSGGAAVVHHRRIEGALESDPAELWA